MLCYDFCRVNYILPIVLNMKDTLAEIGVPIVQMIS